MNYQVLDYCTKVAEAIANSLLFNLMPGFKYFLFLYPLCQWCITKSGKAWLLVLFFLGKTLLFHKYHLHSLSHLYSRNQKNIEFDIKVKQKDITIYKIFDLPKAVQKYTAIIKKYGLFENMCTQKWSRQFKKKAKFSQSSSSSAVMAHCLQTLTTLTHHNLCFQAPHILMAKSMVSAHTEKKNIMQNQPQNGQQAVYHKTS